MLLDCPLVLRLGLDNILNLFLYRREQGEQREVRHRRGRRFRRFFRRRRNGGLPARRLLPLRIYL